MKKIFSITAFFLAIGFLSCKTEFQPPVNTIPTGYLVVEGFIDGGATTEIKLSRTTPLDPEKKEKIFEKNARVTVEDDQNNQYPLFESGNGLYHNNLTLNPGNKYRLNIKTAGGKQYFSQYVEYKISPDIDTVGWHLKNDGLEIYVNTHDPQNNTRYYRWEYEETWEFHSMYNSILKYDAPNVRVVDRDEQVFKCWQSYKSNRVLLNSSVKLEKDIIAQMPMLLITKGNDKLSVLYSIEVKQFPLDVKGYNYWAALRKNTEEIGSIFDPQPSQIKGNIYCASDSTERVVGFINAGATKSKRIFIKNSEVPGNWNSYPDCELVIVEDNPTSLATYFGSNSLIPISSSIANNGATIYTASTPPCVDCTTRGTNIKPVFWP